MATSHALLNVCQKFPAIDNHAHRLLPSAYHSHEDFPFQALTSEAPITNLSDSLTSLASYHAAARLAQLFKLPRDATWDDIKVARETQGWDRICRSCFEHSRIQCVLVDSGLSGPADDSGCRVDTASIDPYVPSAKCIVRVETLAEVCFLTCWTGGITHNA
jgi:hypothetical protein